MGNFGMKLTEVDFCGLDFGKSTDSVVGATLSIAEGGSLLKCNKMDLRPDPNLGELDLQGCPVMPYGICVLASTAMMVASISDLNLSRCGMDAESLATLFGSLSQKKTVKTLDVSHNPLKKAGMLELAKFLHVDTTLQVLVAQGIETVATKCDEMLQFAKAIEINITLAKLDFRRNHLHGAIATQLKRTMEEKRK